MNFPLFSRFSLLRPPTIIWPHFSHFNLVPLATTGYNTRLNYLWDQGIARPKFHMKYMD
jgi:hypothetical protein